VTFGLLFSAGHWLTLRSVGKAANVAVHITIEDHDDRPERMVRDPERYFADARRRAEREVMHQNGWLFSPRRHRHRG
jgi:hypothetical protein